MPIPVPDTTETLICALGLALGLVGFLVGTILIIRGTCLSRARRYRGPRCLGAGEWVALNRMGWRIILWGALGSGKGDIDK